MPNPDLPLPPVPEPSLGLQDAERITTGNDGWWSAPTGSAGNSRVTVTGQDSILDKTVSTTISLTPNNEDVRLVPLEWLQELVDIRDGKRECEFMFEDLIKHIDLIREKLK